MTNINKFSDYLASNDADAVLVFCPVKDVNGERHFTPMLVIHTYPLQCVMFEPVKSDYVHDVHDLSYEIGRTLQGAVPGKTHFNVAIYGKFGRSLVSWSQPLQQNPCIYLFHKVYYMDGSCVHFKPYLKFLDKFVGENLYRAIKSLSNFHLTRLNNLVKYLNLAAPITMDSELIKSAKAAQFFQKMSEENVLMFKREAEQRLVTNRKEQAKKRALKLARREAARRRHQNLPPKKQNNK